MAVRVWAEWFAIVTGEIYLPLEVWEIVKHTSWPRVIILIVNLAIVAYLVWNLLRHRNTKAAANRFKP